MVFSLKAVVGLAGSSGPTSTEFVPTGNTHATTMQAAVVEVREELEVEIEENTDALDDINNMQDLTGLLENALT